VRPVFALGLALLLAGNVGAQGQGTGNRERGTEVPRSSGSQFPVPGSQHAEPGSDLTIYLVTMGNGTRIWERFGHNAIRIVERRTGPTVSTTGGPSTLPSHTFCGGS